MKNALKTTTLALLASTALITSAVAAEKATKHNKHHKFHAPVAETAAPCGNCSGTPSTGLYFGAAAGQQKIAHSMRADKLINAGANRISDKFDLNDRDFVGGVFVGHGLEWMNMYWGLEAEAMFGETKSSALLNTTPANNNFYRVGVKTDNYYGAAARIGKTFCGNLLYARFGIEARQFKTTLETINVAAPTNNPSSQINSKKTKLAFVPGVGFEIPVISGLSARIEAREAFYGSSSKSSQNGDSSVRRRKSSVSTVMLGFAYKTGLLEIK